jgi:uncharacterized protein YcfJ
MKLKNLLKIGIVLSTIGTAATASAGEYVTAQIISSEPVYTQFTERTPRNVCNMQQVPIYGRVGGANASDVLGGMIIGGLIGKGATGKDNGAAAGAVLGGMVAADRAGGRAITGYQQVQNCHVQYTYNTIDKISHYNVIADVNGQQVNLTLRTMPMGDTVRVYVNTTYSVSQ